MVNLGVRLSHKEAKTLVDELWFLRELRMETGHFVQAKILETVFQVFSEQIADNPVDDERWADLMKELEESKNGS